MRKNAKALRVPTSQPRLGQIWRDRCPSVECDASDQRTGCAEVYERLIGIQYPMLCSCKNGRSQIGTGSIRLNEQKPTGLRFVQWIHQDPREATRADPPPESTRAVYLQIESWPAVQAEEPDNIPVLTTRKDSATSLRSFCHQSRRNTNVKTAVKVAGATAKHCIVLHGQSSFLSGHSNKSDFVKTRKRVRPFSESRS